MHFSTRTKELLALMEKVMINLSEGLSSDGVRSLGTVKNLNNFFSVTFISDVNVSN